MTKYPPPYERNIDLDGEWVQYCTHDNVFNTYADIDTIWNQLLELAGLRPIDTTTHGSGSITYIESIEDTLLLDSRSAGRMD